MMPDMREKEKNSASSRLSPAIKRGQTPIHYATIRTSEDRLSIPLTQAQKDCVPQPRLQQHPASSSNKNRRKTKQR